MVALLLPRISTGLANPRSGKRNLAKQARGFQKPSPPGQTRTAADAHSPPDSLPPTVESFDLGGGHVVPLLVPAFDRLGAALGSDADVAAQFKDQFYGAGDVVWPASVALARLVANCPSFVRGRRVIELGCGLGLASAAARLAGPRSLCLSDLNGAVLALALRSCTELHDQTTTAAAAGGSGATAGGTAAGTAAGGCPVEALEGLDWTQPSTWPRGGAYGRGPSGGGGEPAATGGELVTSGGGGFEVVLASDVLYSEAAVASVAALVAHLLRPADANPAAQQARVQPPSSSGGLQEGEEEAEEEAEVVRRALIVDPANREHRTAFVEAARRVGLAAVPVPFPGHPDLVLINITPAA